MVFNGGTTAFSSYHTIKHFYTNMTLLSVSDYKASMVNMGAVKPFLGGRDKTIQEILSSTRKPQESSKKKTV